MRKADILDSRAERLKVAQDIRARLAEHGTEVSLQEISSNFDKYQKLLDDHQNQQTTDEADELNAEQIATIKTLESYYQLLTEGLEDIYFDKSIRKVEIIDGEVTEFTLAIVPPHLIKSRVKVIPQNLRDQRSLNRHSLAYILKTLEDEGQHYEGEGYIDPEDPDKIIWVVDGGSRAASCELAQKPYRIFLSDKKFSQETGRKRSRRANDYKPHSNWEHGTELLQLLESGLSLDEIEVETGLRKPRISLLINAVKDVPYEVYERFSVGTNVPRRILEWLVPAVNRLKSANKYDEFIALTVPFDKSDFNTDDDVKASLTNIINTLAPTVKASKFDDRGSYKIKKSLNTKKGTFKLEISDANEDLIQKINEFIESL